jgi:glycyl-tRNA synthetase beta chain
MGRDFLLEIGTEEIPSGYLDPALAAMEKHWRDLMEGNRIEIGSIKAWGTPRRLALMVDDMAEVQRELVTKTMGPPVNVAFDDKGEPTKAALGFAEKCGVPVGELGVEETKKGKYLCAVRVDEGGEVSLLLPRLIPEFIDQIPFPKYMRWGEGDTRFVRPIHWLLCLYGDRPVEFRYGGMAGGDRSRGHRFMAPDFFRVETPASYPAALRERSVIVDNKVRMEEAKKAIDELASAHGGIAYGDDDLLAMVSNMVEYPVAVWGCFDEEYLKLPDGVLINTMVEHQHFFPVEQADGALMPNFIALGNTGARDLKVVARGNEKVLRARLADAMFFFREDSSKPLEDFVEGLKSVLYQEKLGTSYEKMERFRELALSIQSLLNVGSPEMIERAALLCKADLMTLMVYEFPKLQGVMGREYALLSGEKEEVAEAIFEHYLPRYAGDRLPETVTGALLSMADKLDTVVGSFGIGVKPTGNVDPHGLRRQTLGIINIIMENGYRLSLSDVVDKALDILKDKITGNPGEVKTEVLDFFARRLENMFLSESYRYDLVDAVIESGFDDLVRLKLRLDALTEFSQRPDFETLTTTFKRVVNIIKSEVLEDPKPALLAEKHERQLYTRAGEVQDKLASLLEGEHYMEALEAIAQLRAPVDDFFDNVLVMADDLGVRNNRLALLGMVAGMFSSIADFSKVVIGG